MINIFRVLVCFALWVSAAGAMAQGQISCTSGKPSVNLINGPASAYNRDDTGSTLTTSIPLFSTGSVYLRDGEDLIIAVDAKWSNGVPTFGSKDSFVTINVNGTDYFEMTTGESRDTIGWGQPLNGASTVSDGFSRVRISEQFLNGPIRVLLRLPSSVTQISSITSKFRSTPPFNSFTAGDDGGFDYLAAWACPPPPNVAEGQISCDSGQLSANLINGPASAYNMDDTSSTLSTSIPLISNSSAYLRDGNDLVIAVNANWSNGVIDVISAESFMTINVNGTDYFEMRTGDTNSTIGTGQALNGASTASGASSFNIGQNSASRVLLRLPSSVTQISSITSKFRTTASASLPAGDDGGFTYLSAWACPQVTKLSVAKDNGTTRVAAGSTTTYSLSFANNGPAGANNAVAKDTPGAGLSACVATCTSATGGAECPSAALSDLFTSTGVPLAVFPSGSRINFSVACRVSATGL